MRRRSHAFLDTTKTTTLFNDAWCKTIALEDGDSSFWQWYLFEKTFRGRCGKDKSGAFAMIFEQRSPIVNVLWLVDRLKPERILYKTIFEKRDSSNSGKWLVLVNQFIRQ
jgi:hypothetical protein